MSLIDDAVGQSFLAVCRDPSRLAQERLSAALERVLGAPVRGVLLYGSRARGEQTEASDVDALVFADVEHPRALRGTSAGVDLDVEVLPFDAIARMDPSAWVHVVPGVPLADDEGRVSTFLGAVVLRRTQGPQALSPDEHTKQALWCARMLARIAGAEPTAAVVLSAELASALVPLWFALRRQWPRGTRSALAHWSDHAPAHRALWDAWASAHDAQERSRVLRRIVASTFAG